MKLGEIVRTADRLGQIRGRKPRVEILTGWLQRLPAEEIEIAVHYLSGTLPQGRIGIGRAALRDVMDEPPAARPSLSLSDVDKHLGRLGDLGGDGAERERHRALGALFSLATRTEQAFLARLLAGELCRAGLEEAMAEAIARAALIPIEEVRRAVRVSGDPAAVAHAALNAITPGLAQFSLQPLHPVRPMLTRPADSLRTVLEKLGRARFEYGLDGVRVQVHHAGRRVRVFSRGLEDITARVPEIVEAVGHLSPRDIVLDGEAVALRADGTPCPTRVTSRRLDGKGDVAAQRARHPLQVLFFDCLHLDGDDLLDRPTTERFEALAEVLPPRLVVPWTITADPAEAEAFLENALDTGHSGLVAKPLDAPYEPGRRGGWVHVRPCHTLDLVVLAAEWGHGRRRGRLSNLHVGARDPKGGGFLPLGKTFRGLSDKMLRWQTDRLQEIAIGRENGAVHVRPELVVEIACDGIRRSPGKPGGLTLLSPRIRRYRPDRTAADADTIDAVRALATRQV